MRVTAETLTEAQIKELWLFGGNLISGRTLFIALGESVGGRRPSSEEILAARERCAAAWNTRHGEDLKP